MFDFFPRKIYACPRLVQPTVYADELSYSEQVGKLAYGLEQTNTDVEDLEERVSTGFKGVDKALQEYETIKDLTDVRKLSGSGDFTGSVAGVEAADLVVNVASNTADIRTVLKWISEGHTGYLIDCGYFGQTEPSYIVIDCGVFA